MQFQCPAELTLFLYTGHRFVLTTRHNSDLSTVQTLHIPLHERPCMSPTQNQQGDLWICTHHHIFTPLFMVSFRTWKRFYFALQSMIWCILKVRKGRPKEISSGLNTWLWWETSLHTRVRLEFLDEHRGEFFWEYTDEPRTHFSSQMKYAIFFSK